MAHNTSGKADELEKLRMENELKKAKLILEHGAVFSELSGGSNISPVIENDFLKNIEEFEKSFKNVEQIALYDFIRKPEYIFVDIISDSDIGTELERLINILNENGINLDTLCDVEAREVYRFITEELFLHEIDNMRIPGMMTCFIYEEFHPNHEYDIRNHSIDGIKAFLNKKSDFYKTFFTKKAEDDPGLKHFRDSFKSFSIKKMDITDLSIEKENATVSFIIDFSATIEGNNEKQHYKGNGIIELVYWYDFWCIEKIHFPGVVKL